MLKHIYIRMKVNNIWMEVLSDGEKNVFEMLLNAKMATEYALHICQDP